MFHFAHLVCSVFPNTRIMYLSLYYHDFPNDRYNYTNRFVCDTLLISKLSDGQHELESTTPGHPWTHVDLVGLAALLKEI